MNEKQKLGSFGLILTISIILLHNVAQATTPINANKGEIQNFAKADLSDSCCILPGDVNLSGGVDIADLTYTINFMFKAGPAPLCWDNADINASCAIDFIDLTYRINFMFKGGPLPLCGCTGLDGKK